MTLHKTTSEQSIKLLSHFAEISDHYDGFIIDLWGVLHDGVMAYPGAVDCLRRLKQAGKKILLLSNAPRRAAVVADGTAKIGFLKDSYDFLHSSGEETWQQLYKRSDNWHRRLGTKCLAIFAESDRPFFQGLDLQLVQEPQHAEFVLAVGIRNFGDTVDLYASALKKAQQQGLPMLCVNPDLEIIRQGKREICAGALAQYYEQIGGEVRYHGKPHPAVYQHALKLLGGLDKNKILAVGDALRTDIAGATTMGLDSLWILGGIHAEGLLLNQQQGLKQRLVEMAEKAELKPVAGLPRFVW